MTNRRLLFARCVLFLLSFNMLRAEEPGTFIFLPGGTLVAPLAANPQEPRMGVRKTIGTSRLKLDIGNAVDFLEYRISEQDRFRIGVAFFAYAFSTSSDGFRLQLDAVDGFFGGHIIYRTDLDGAGLTLRLRLMHLSAHFLDGRYDIERGEWKDGRLPVPFLKDFGELMAGYDVPLGPVTATVYSAFTYATHLRPAIIKRISTFHGFELRSDELIGPAFSKPVTFYLADHFTVSGVPRYQGTNTCEAGVKFGVWDNTGIRLYVSYHRGLDFFSQYYDVRIEEWGLGFAMDFW